MEATQNPALQMLRAAIGKTATNSPSALTNWLQPEVRAVEAGQLTFAYTVRSEFVNPVGTLHGGVTAAIMDDLIGATVFTLGLPQHYTTISNSIDYFFPARSGEVVLAEASIVKQGRQIINAQFELWDASRERLLARGTSNLLRVDK